MIERVMMGKAEAVNVHEMTKQEYTREVNGRTFHVHALFLSERCAEFLNFCGKASLHILSGQNLVVIGLSVMRRWRESVRCGGGQSTDALNKGLTFPKVLL